LQKNCAKKIHEKYTQNTPFIEVATTMKGVREANWMIVSSEATA